MPSRFALCLVFLPITAGAQEPLSVIEWLGQNPPDSGGSVLLEPPVSKTGLQPPVKVSPLETLAAPVGLVPTEVTGLSPNLWTGSDPDDLIRLITDIAVRDSPAMQTLLYTLLLSESVPPSDAAAAERLLLARIDRLLDLGATDPAQALAEQSNPTSSAALFARWFDATLLTGSEDQSCRVLLQMPHLAPDYAARIFCSARQGDWQTAALLLEAAHALELMPQDRLDLLDRFLSPDVFEGAPPLTPPQRPDPLTFRLFETIGERLPTASLPRAFATADLRDVSGWKAQLEAAERLTRIGAISPNQLLGLYTDRKASASGGIWDRVRALQQFDTALQSGSAGAVAKTLPVVWAAMREAQLEVPFAALFTQDLSAIPLQGTNARDLAWHIQLLSPAYQSVPPAPDPDNPNQQFLAAVARGDPITARAPDAIASALAEGLAQQAATPTQADPQLGQTILNAMQDFDSGARGNLDDLSKALGSFQAVGLQDTARRAALQLMLLKEN